jgi:hypothetical protein
VGQLVQQNTWMGLRLLLLYLKDELLSWVKRQIKGVGQRTKNKGSKIKRRRKTY